MVVKARHQGNSTILTIPKHIKAPDNAEFNVYLDDDGNIVYEPVKNSYDIWSDKNLDNLDYPKMRQEELHDLGYNPRETSPVRKERTSD